MIIGIAVFLVNSSGLTFPTLSFHGFKKDEQMKQFWLVKITLCL